MEVLEMARWTESLVFRAGEPDGFAELTEAALLSWTLAV